MIYEALEVLQSRIELYFESVFTTEPSVGIRNIADPDSIVSTGSTDSKDVILTLVNMKEETTLKNFPAHRINIPDQTVEYKNPPINLNLFVLISATQSSYKEAINSITSVIECFQEQKILKDSFPKGDLKCILEIQTPSFEQLNHLWSMLGGKQYPAVLYQVQMIQVESDENISSGELITEIEGNLKHIK